MLDTECPFCHVPIERWRLDFYERYKDDDDMIAEAMVNHEKDFGPHGHALIHVPECF